MLGACKKHPQAYFLYVEDCFLQSDNADARIFSKDKKTHEDGNPVLCVLLVEEICVYSSLLGYRKPLCRFVACCLLLVAKNCVGCVIVCQVLCAAFMRFIMRKCVTVIGAFICHQYRV